MSESAFLPLPSNDQGAKIAAQQAQIDLLTSRVGAAESRLFNYPPLTIQAFDQNATPYRYTILGQQTGYAPATATTFPFQVTVQANPASPGNYQASVYWNSSLLLNYVLNNTQTITGLADEVAPDGDGNMNWFTFDNGNDLIWLEITLDGFGDVTAAAINSWGLGGIWQPSDLPGEYGSGHGPFEYQLTYDDLGNSIFNQYIARIAIFSSQTSTVSPFPVVNTQLLDHNLIMTGDVYNGQLYTTSDGPAVIGIVMPRLYSGPYVTI